MRTGGRAGLGKMPNATARHSRSRRGLVRVLCAGGFAVAGSVVCAVAANAAEVDQPTESADGLLGSLTSAVEPLTIVVEDGAETLLTGDLALTADLLGDESLLAGAQLTELVEEPLTELTSTVRLDDAAGHERAALSADRESANTVIDRSHDRTQDVVENEPGAERVNNNAPAHDLRRLLGRVDSLLPDVTAAAELAGGLTEVLPARSLLANGPADEPRFSTQETPDPLGAVSDIASLLDLPLAGGLHTLDALAPVLAPLDSVIRTAVPVVTNLDPLLGSSGEKARGIPAAPFALDQAPTASAKTAWRSSSSEPGTTRLADTPDSEDAVGHSSLDVSPDKHPGDSRESLRPSLLTTPVAGFTALHAGAPGAAVSADQAGPSSHALLPEEAVLRARLFSAAAYARNIEAKPLREANDPPVSPD